MDKSLGSFNFKNILLKNRAICYSQLGFASHKFGKVKKGFKWINKALELDPNLEHAWFKLALLYFDKKNYIATQKVCQKVLEINLELKGAN